jgi:hypothetical protein
MLIILLLIQTLLECYQSQKSSLKAQGSFTTSSFDVFIIIDTDIIRVLPEPKMFLKDSRVFYNFKFWCLKVFILLLIRTLSECTKAENFNKLRRNKGIYYIKIPIVITFSHLFAAPTLHKINFFIFFFPYIRSFAL